MTLKLGVPSKGRLMEQTFDWFSERGLTLARTGSAREYAGAVEGVDGVELVLLSASEIPRELAAGRIHLGVTGSDLVRETLPDWAASVTELAPMGFGHADLILAVPVSWVDVETLDDLDAAAAAFPRAPRVPAADCHQVSPPCARAFARAWCGRLPTGRQPGRDRRHDPQHDRRSGGRYHLYRRNAARQPSENIAREPPVHRSQATLFAARGAAWAEAGAALQAHDRQAGCATPGRVFAGRVNGCFPARRVSR